MADIEVAVGRQDHPVDRVLVEIRLGEPIGLADALGAGGAAGGAEALQRRHDLAFLRPLGRLQHHAGGTGIGDDGDAVRLAHLVHQHAQRFLQQRQLVRRIHRAGGIHQEHQIGRRAGFRRNVVSLQADADDLRALVPGRVVDRDIGLERLFPGGGDFVVVAEIIDQLLGAHRILGRQYAVLQITPDHGVGGRIHVDREGRDRFRRDQLHWVVLEFPVFLVLRARLWRNRHDLVLRDNAVTGAAAGVRPAGDHLLLGEGF